MRFQRSAHTVVKRSHSDDYGAGKASQSRENICALNVTTIKFLHFK
jgi:hypothetical protein